MSKTSGGVRANAGGLTGAGNTAKFAERKVSDERSKENAQEILRTLGGMNRLVAMTGARNFVRDGLSLSFRVPSQAAGAANYVKVTYDQAADLYNLEMGRIKGDSYKVLDKKEGLWNDQLKPAIENGTKMRLSLR